jgi:hypothetical protein
MKKIIVIIIFTIYLAINLSSLIAQTNLTIEGTVVNNTDQGTWYGVNIERSKPTTFIYRNNSITSVNSSTYQLQAGDEEILSSNNNLKGEVISGNKFTWNGTDLKSITHGIFTGYNINATIEYNYLDKVPMAIIRKSNGMTNTAGAVAYNIIKNPIATALAVKGMNGVNIYNNTIYSNQKMYNGTTGVWRGLIDIYANNNPEAFSKGTKIKNNIFYTVHQIYNITVLEAEDLVGFESDYNVFYCESGTPVFNYLGSSKTFAQWQSLGYDKHSIVINPNFNNTVEFVPASRLDYGTDLGTAWQFGLSTTAKWVPGVAPETANQNGTWQVGARVYNTSPLPAKIKMTVYPNPTHKIINILLENNTQDNGKLPRLIKIFDILGRVMHEKLLETGISNATFPINLKPGIYVVILLSGDLEIASQTLIVI